MSFWTMRTLSEGVTHHSEIGKTEICLQSIRNYPFRNCLAIMVQKELSCGKKRSSKTLV